MKKGSKKNTKITRTKAKSTTSYKWLVFWIVLIILAALVGWKAYNSKNNFKFKS
jgi:predicted negative regulator of RcsB-dependent stress response